MSKNSPWIWTCWINPFRVNLMLNIQGIMQKWYWDWITILWYLVSFECYVSGSGSSKDVAVFSTLIICIFSNAVLIFPYRESIVSCMSTIHSFVQKDCNQIPWAGSIEEKVKLTTLKLHGKKEIVKVHTQRVENLPYTKLIMKERIKVGGLHVK